MNSDHSYTIIDGIKCYHPESAENYLDYPSEGFDVTDQLEEESFWCRSRSRLLKFIIAKYTQSKSSLRFLELGCGTGFFLRDLAKQQKFDLTGSDIYLGGLKYAQKKLTTVQFIQLDATKSYIDEKYDVIGAFDVIEHIEQDETVIKNVYHSLREQGLFIITVPQYQFLWSQLDELVKHKRRYSRKDLLSKLRKGGFDIVYSSSFVTTLFPLMLVSRLLDRKKSVQTEGSNDFEKRVSFPRFLNWIFDKLMHIDEWLIRCGLSLPFGGSLLVVAQKSANNEIS